jgi:hypothetical protein
MRSSPAKKTPSSSPVKKSDSSTKLDDGKSSNNDKDLEKKVKTPYQNGSANAAASPSKGKKASGKGGKKEEASPKGGNSTSSSACVLKVPVVERRLSTARSVSPASDDDVPLSVVAATTRKDK